MASIGKHGRADEAKLDVEEDDDMAGLPLDMLERLGLDEDEDSDGGESLRRRLEGEFSKLDADSDGTVTFEEVAAFLDERAGGPGRGSVDATKAVFAMVDADGDGEMTLAEYVDAYMEAYASARSDLLATGRQLLETEEALVLAEDSLAGCTKSERRNSRTGIMQSADGRSLGQLKVFLRGCHGLRPHADGGKLNTFVTMEVVPAAAIGGRSKVETELRSGTAAPQWDEEVIFKPLLSKGGSLKVTVFNKTHRMTDDCLGSIEVGFGLLLDQKEKVLREDLVGADGDEAYGVLSLRAQLLYSEEEYFRASVQHCRAKRERLLHSMESRRQRLEDLKAPFALVGASPLLQYLQSTADTLGLEVDLTGERVTISNTGACKLFFAIFILFAIIFSLAFVYRFGESGQSNPFIPG
eukprot:PLAT6088.3.p1 GENE.PLAT6088.3~~PLAT6088.3.p1  ORF type:complete len:419 (-),score=221.62 PLAT6088.3:195-1427(-)